MSKNINVNPGNYKVRGRERPGKDVAAEILKQQYAAEVAREHQAFAPPVPAKAALPKKRRKPAR